MIQLTEQHLPGLLVAQQVADTMAANTRDYTQFQRRAAGELSGRFRLMIEDIRRTTPTDISPAEQ